MFITSMGCFLCLGGSSNNNKKHHRKLNKISNNDNINRCRRADRPQPHPGLSKVSPGEYLKDERKPTYNSATSNKSNKSNPSKKASSCNGQTDGVNARAFAYVQLVAATENFKDDYFLGEGGFGKVFKGRLHDTNEIVAIKQLDRNGCQGIREFLVEAFTLSNADHPNLVKLIGYCAEGDQRLLVYEYMPLGSLEDHLYETRAKRKALDWNSRMKIVAGAAQGLAYLHNKMTPPIIYRDLKCSNILLGDGYFPKLSDFGLAKVGPSGDETHVSTRVMGTYGYCAPEYALTGQLTFKSDIYSFGVVLLEIITGRRAIDHRRNGPEQNIVEWAKPLFKDRKRFCQMADPMLQGQYPVRGLYQVLAIAAMCVQEKPSMRPLISDVVTALNYLASHKYYPNVHAIHSPRGLRRHGHEMSKYESDMYPPMIPTTCSFKEDGEHKHDYGYGDERAKSE